LLAKVAGFELKNTLIKTKPSCGLVSGFSLLKREKLSRIFSERERP
jgi:hypothetical protein